MRRRVAWVWLSGLAATVSACGVWPGESPPPAAPKPVAIPAPAPAATSAPASSPAPAATPTAASSPAPAATSTAASLPAAAATPAATPSASVPSPAGAEASRLVPMAPELAKPEVPNYEVRGRRDPFAKLDVVSGPTGLTIASTKLTGIIFSGRSALALVETSDGIGYILRPGDTLGDGHLLEVGSDTAVFAVAARPGAPVNRVVLRLAAN
jgi:hypothetical protein